MARKLRPSSAVTSYQTYSASGFFFFFSKGQYHNLILVEQGHREVHFFLHSCTKKQKQQKKQKKSYCKRFAVQIRP